MRVCVFGAGAIGGFIAAMLANAASDAEVSVVARGAHLEAMRRNGLRLRHRDGRPDVVAHFTHVASEADPLPPQDLLIVTLKATALEAAAAAVARLMAPDGVAIYINNGIPWWWDYTSAPAPAPAVSSRVGDRALWSEVGVERVLGCVAILSNAVEAPGVVSTDGANAWYIGEPEGGLSERLQSAVSLFRAGGLQADACPALRDRIWQKLLLNVPNHALASLTRLTTDQIYARPDLLEIALGLVEEVRAIAGASGSTLPPMSAQALRQHLMPRIPGARPSMLQDVLAGRRLEVEAVFGRLVEIGSSKGIDMPCLRISLGLLRALDQSLALAQGPHA